MLILTRRTGEAIVIGDDVNITVLGIKGNQVRLGINAPLEIAVNRVEVHERILQEKALLASETFVEIPRQQKGHCHASC